MCIPDSPVTGSDGINLWTVIFQITVVMFFCLFIARKTLLNCILLSLSLNWNKKNRFSPSTLAVNNEIKNSFYLFVCDHGRSFRLNVVNIEAITGVSFHAQFSVILKINLTEFRERNVRLSNVVISLI